MNMTKKFRPILVAIAMIGAGASALTAQESSGTASVAIADGILMLKTGDLHFGELMSPDAAGYVTITTVPDDQATSVTTVDPSLTMLNDTSQPATFSVTRTGGTGNPHFWVELPTSVVLQRVGGGGTDMTVDNFNANVVANCIGGAPATAKGQCPTADYTLLVGARLGINASQPGGSYRNTFIVRAHRF